MAFPQKSAFFDLNELECRMLATRIYFQKFMQALIGKQFKIQDNIVNVPGDVTITVSMLPWLPRETGTVKVNLKGKLQCKVSVLSLNGRPQKIVEGGIWLVNNSSLYKDEGIVFNQDWVTNYNEQISQHDIDDSECDQQSVNDEENSNNIDTKKLDDEDE